MSWKRTNQSTWDSDDEDDQLLEEDGLSTSAFKESQLGSDDEDKVNELLGITNDDGDDEAEDGTNPTEDQGEKSPDLEEVDDIILDIQDPEDSTLFNETDASIDPQVSELTEEDGGDVEAEENVTMATDDQSLAEPEDRQDDDDAEVKEEQEAEEEEEEEEDDSQLEVSHLTAESRQAEEEEEEDNDDDSDEDKDSRRDRFRSERKPETRVSTVTKSKSKDAIPDTLDITEEQQQEIDKFMGPGRGRGGHGRGRGRGRGAGRHPFQSAPQGILPHPMGSVPMPHGSLTGPPLIGQQLTGPPQMFNAPPSSIFGPVGVGGGASVGPSHSWPSVHSAPGLAVSQSASVSSLTKSPSFLDAALAITHPKPAPAPRPLMGNKILINPHFKRQGPGEGQIQVPYSGGNSQPAPLMSLPTSHPGMMPQRHPQPGLPPQQSTSWSGLMDPRPQPHLPHHPQHQPHHHHQQQQHPRFQPPQNMPPHSQAPSRPLFRANHPPGVGTHGPGIPLPPHQHSFREQMQPPSLDRGPGFYQGPHGNMNNNSNINNNNMRPLLNQQGPTGLPNQLRPFGVFGNGPHMQGGPNQNMPGAPHGGHNGPGPVHRHPGHEQFRGPAPRGPMMGPQGQRAQGMMGGQPPQQQQWFGNPRAQGQGQGPRHQQGAGGRKGDNYGGHNMQQQQQQQQRPPNSQNNQPAKKSQSMVASDKLKARARRFQQNNLKQVQSISVVGGGASSKRPAQGAETEDHTSPAKVAKVEDAMDPELAQKLEEQRRRREEIQKIKEMRRQAQAAGKRETLKQKLLGEGRTPEEVESILNTSKLEVAPPVGRQNSGPHQVSGTQPSMAAQPRPRVGSQSGPRFPGQQAHNQMPQKVRGPAPKVIPKVTVQGQGHQGGGKVTLSNNPSPTDPSNLGNPTTPTKPRTKVILTKVIRKKTGDVGGQGQVNRQVVASSNTDRTVVMGSVSSEDRRVVALPQQGGQICVDNLSSSTSKATIRGLFESIGKVESVVLLRAENRAHVSFERMQDAVMATQKFNRHMLDLSCISIALL